MFIALVSGLGAGVKGNGLPVFSQKLQGQFHATVLNDQWHDQKDNIITGIKAGELSVVIAYSYGANETMSALRDAGVVADLLILIEPVRRGWYLFWWLLAMKWKTRDIAKRTVCYYLHSMPVSVVTSDGENICCDDLGLSHGNICESAIVQARIVDQIKKLVG